jgi:hypothetical protein
MVQFHNFRMKKEQGKNTVSTPKDYKVGYKRPPLEYRWVKGKSGNPNGRPKTPMKDYAKKRLQDMTEKEREEFLDGIPKIEIWRMAEGNPSNATDVTSGGKSLVIQISQEVADKNNVSTPRTEPNS